MNQQNRKQQANHGRNGVDFLGKLALGCGIFCYAMYFVTGEMILQRGAMVLFVYTLFRMFSSNVEARSKENQAVQELGKLYKLRWELRKTHKVFRCESCGTLVRVPKGQGKVMVTCPVCKKAKLFHT